MKDAPFRLSHPFTDQITRAHAEERRLALGRDRLGQERLARPRRAVQEDALPGRALAGEEMRELDGQDDGLAQGLFGRFEPGDVRPLDVGRLGEDRAWLGREQRSVMHCKNIWSEMREKLDALAKPARSFFVSASPSSSSPPFFPTPDEPPPAAFPLPSAPTPILARLSSAFERCSLSFSARSRYSVNFLRISSLSLSFFSSERRPGKE